MQTTKTKQHIEYYQTLVSQLSSIGLKYQSIFQLKHFNDVQAVKTLIKAYPKCKQSILLSHEILYALGQFKQCMIDEMKQFLIQRIKDEHENNLSRHEAAQALSNYFPTQLLPIYDQYKTSNCLQLAYTCQIAYQKIKHSELHHLYGKLYNGTKQPAISFNKQQIHEFIKNNNYVEIYQSQGCLGLLLQQQISLWIKYRILYYMRDQNNQSSRQQLCRLLSNEFYHTQTSLLKHQICFILGQIGIQGYENLIRQCIQNQHQADIVRHQALAAIASQSNDKNYLKKFLLNPSKLISQSAKVAIYYIEYWNEK